MVIVAIVLLILALIAFWLWKNTQQPQQLPQPQPQPTAPAPQQQEEPQEEEEEPTDGEPVTGTKIYPDASPPHECTNVSDGELEQNGDRKEPQIACDFDFLNTEATCYIKVTGSVNDTLSIKLRGPKHSGIPDADMCNNIHYISLGSESKEPFGKQSGHTAEYCEFGSPTVSIPNDVWVGVKAIEWNEGDGVHFQTWLDNPEGSGWRLAADEIDTGGLGSCSGPAREAFTTSPCQGVDHPISIGFRVDGLRGGGDVEFKNLSAREIAVPSAPRTTAAELARVMRAKVNTQREFEFNFGYRSLRIGNLV